MMLTKQTIFHSKEIYEYTSPAVYTVRKILRRARMSERTKKAYMEDWYASLW